MKHIGFILAISVFIFQAMMVPLVGMSWDEPSSFFMGRANLKFWMTGNRAYLNDLRNKTLFADSPIQYIYGEDLYPPFAFLVSSFTSFVLAEKTHILSVWDAHHVGEIFLGSIGVWAMYGLAVEVGLSVWIASGVTLVYALYPTIADLMRNDAKDVPLVSLLIASSYFFVRWVKLWRVKKYRLAWISGLGCAVFLGLAEATKPTAVILVPVVILWLLISSVGSAEFRKSIRPIGSFMIAGFSLLVIALLVFIIGWPWLWDDPVGKLTEVMSFFKTVGFNMPVPLFGEMYRAGKNLPNLYPFIILFVQSPIELSILALVGMVIAIRQFVKLKKVYPLFFVVWFLVAMGRFLIPGVLIYARVRHFIDAMPAFIILAGFGAQAIVEWVKNKLPRMGSLALMLTLGVVIIHEAVITFRFFPYEMTYFNVLAGGTKHVAQQGLFDVGTASAVKEAMEFIARDSGGQKVRVYPCLLMHVARFYGGPTITMARAPETAQYSIFPNSPSWFDGMFEFSNAHHELVYSVRRDGADLFYVFKYKEPVGWRCGWETVSNYED